jgi:alpha-glucosidase
MHNLYGLLMAQATYEQVRRVRPEERPFIVTRAGFAGVQRYSAVWTGDNVASWEHLALGIRIMLGLGLSRVPFVGTDVGGFVGSPSPELFARWIQLGVFSPFFRAHTTANTLDQEPWSFGERVETISREFITLRYRLLPYRYSLLWEAHRTGAPPLRPLFWHFQTDSMAYRAEFQHQFMAGERLLLAPVVAEGETVRSVYLPTGRWINLNTDSVYDGDRVVHVEAPLERLPMFLRAGGVVPMREPAQWIGQAVATDLTFDVFPGGEATGGFLLYEDDGTSHAYEHGSYRSTELTAVQQEDGVRVVRHVRHDGHAAPTGRRLHIRIRGVASAPRRVTVDGWVIPEVDGAEGRRDGRTTARVGW